MALIDRDAAIKAATCWKLMPESELMYALKTGIRSLIEKVPAVDAVEVVFCKDCEYSYTEGLVHERLVCEKHPELGDLSDDWFCADCWKA